MKSKYKTEEYRNIIRQSTLITLAYFWTGLPEGATGKGKTDKLIKHSYVLYYHHLFCLLELNDIFKQDSEMNILEIGIEKGGSLGLWRDYCYNSKIFGLDYRDKDCDGRDIKYFEDEKISISIFDSTDSKKTEETYDNNYFDLIFDDGSHKVNDQFATFENLYSKLKPGGIYIIEDIESVEDADLLSSMISKSKNINTHGIADLSGVIQRGDDIIIVLCKPKENNKNYYENIMSIAQHALEMVRVGTSMENFDSHSAALIASNEWISFRKYHELQKISKQKEKKK